MDRERCLKRPGHEDSGNPLAVVWHSSKWPITGGAAVWPSALGAHGAPIGSRGAPVLERLLCTCRVSRAAAFQLHPLPVWQGKLSRIFKSLVFRPFVRTWGLSGLSLLSCVFFAAARPLSAAYGAGGSIANFQNRCFQASGEDLWT